jgi:hypothetical protein
MLPLLNYHSIMFLNLSLNQRILISTSSSLRLGFLLCLAISCTSCFVKVSLNLTNILYCGLTAMSITFCVFSVIFLFLYLLFCVFNVKY